MEYRVIDNVTWAGRSGPSVLREGGEVDGGGGQGRFDSGGYIVSDGRDGVGGQDVVDSDRL